MAFWDYPSLASFPYLRLSLFIFGRHAGQEKGVVFLCVTCRVQYLSRSVACSYSRLSGGVIVFLSIFPTLRFFPFLLRSSLVLRLVEKRIGI